MTVPVLEAPQLAAGVDLTRLFVDTMLEWIAKITQFGHVDRPVQQPLCLVVS
ncbi:MAG: hypothetical protein ABSH33_09810 [Steroidobacteraceae bacterium]|jgi:hypothetical protein